MFLWYVHHEDFFFINVNFEHIIIVWEITRKQNARYFFELVILLMWCIFQYQFQLCQYYVFNSLGSTQRNWSVADKRNQN